jgi:hypothetical protein
LGYKVIMSPGAAKEFRKLDSTIQKRVAILVNKIEASINPRFSGKALKGNDKVSLTFGAMRCALRQAQDRLIAPYG